MAHNATAISPTTMDRKPVRNQLKSSMPLAGVHPNDVRPIQQARRRAPRLGRSQRPTHTKAHRLATQPGIPTPLREEGGGE